MSCVCVSMLNLCKYYDYLVNYKERENWYTRFFSSGNFSLEMILSSFIDFIFLYYLLLLTIIFRFSCIFADYYRRNNAGPFSFLSGKYNCEFCGKSGYKTVKSLRFHQTIECRKDPSFACIFCDYKSYRKSNLLRHMQVHYRFGRRETDLSYWWLIIVIIILLISTRGTEGSFSSRIRLSGRWCEAIIMSEKPYFFLVEANDNIKSLVSRKARNDVNVISNIKLLLLYLIVKSSNKYLI